MNKLKLYKKIIQLFIRNKIVTCEDIGRSYTMISKYYEDLFLETMHKYNDEVLMKLLDCISHCDNLNILDLGAGTGYNSLFLQRRLQGGSYTLVDISRGMLAIAEEQTLKKSSFVESDMLSYLKSCDENSFDVIVCCWALKYQPPLQIIKQFQRALKKDGYIAVILNTAGTLPEVQRVYPRMLEANIDKIDKLMLRLPNPKNKKVLNHWFTKHGFQEVTSKQSAHRFVFYTSEELTEFLTSTGALAGFDVMIKLRDKEIKAQMSKLFQKDQIQKATHKFVYGIYKK